MLITLTYPDYTVEACHLSKVQSDFVHVFGVFLVFVLKGAGLIGVNRTVSAFSLLVKVSHEFQNETLCVFANSAH